MSRDFFKTGVFAVIVNLIVCSISVLGQPKVEKIIAGTILNSISKEPVAFASIGIEGTSIGTSSNTDGAFRLSVPDANLTSNLFISCIGFKTRFLNLSTVTAVSNLGQPMQILLDEQASELREIVVTSKGYSPFEVFKEAAKTTNEKSYSPAILHTYYREFVKKNSAYTKFSDALVDYYLPGADKWDERSEIETKIIESRVKSVKAPVDSGLDVNLRPPFNLKVLPGYCNAERLLKHFTKDGNERNYDFIISEDTIGSGMYQIIITPKKEVEAMLFSGIIYIDKTAMTIRSAEIEMPKSHSEFSKIHNLIFAKEQVNHLKINVEYEKLGEQCFIKHMRVSAGLRIFDRKKTDLSYLFISEFVTNKVDVVNIDHFNKNDLFKKNNLSKSGNNFQNKFWEEQNGLIATKEENDIIASLTSKAEADNP